MPPVGFEPAVLAAANPRWEPHGHRDRRVHSYLFNANLF